MPGIIYEDNEGAIFLAKNRQVGMRTKHIDIKYHFIRELIGRNFLDIRYVRSEDNYADLTTKNVGNEIFDKLFNKGIQVGNIVTKRENVGRTSGVSTGNGVRRFTYDVLLGTVTGEDELATAKLEHGTDGWDLEK